MPELKPVDLISASLSIVNRLPDMTAFQERLFRACRTRIFQEFRRNITVSDEPYAILKHDDFFTAAGGLAFYGILEIEPIHGLAIVALSVELVAAMVDDLFGAGALRTEIGEPKGEFTPMERRISRRLIDLFLPALDDAFAPHFVSQARLVRTDVHATLASVADPDEPFTVFSSRVAVPTGGGFLHFAIPYRGLEAMKSAFTGPRSFGALREGESEWANRLDAALDETALSVAVEIGFVDTSLARVSALRVGEVLPVRFVEHGLIKSADGAVLAVGDYGRRDEEVVVRITGPGPRARPVNLS